MRLSAAGNIPIHLINKPDSLQESLQELARSPTISVDLEFDNNSYGYGVTLCLVQVATPAACYIIDPLANLDLGGLYALFSDPNIQMLVHSPGEDLRLLHSLCCYPQNLFDTEIAARLLNYEKTSLTVMLQEKLGVGMDKKLQRSNWLRRPLSEEQLLYAAEDVLWLHPLKEILLAEAAERNLLPFIQEEQELLDATRYPVSAKTTFLKPADQYNLSPRDQYILNELLRYRDELARELNRPPYQVMSEEMVKELAAGTRIPESIIDSAGVHPRIKNSSIANEFASRLEGARKEAAAQQLPTEKTRAPRLTSDRQAAMRKAADDKEKVFAPIQQALEQRLGSYAAKVILNNRVVNELLNCSITLQDIKPVYRQELIREVATAAGISLKEYEC